MSKALAVLACGVLWACSGGTGNTVTGGTGGPPTASVVSVRVSDTFGAPVGGAMVGVSLGGSTVSGSTDAQGRALLAINSADGMADVLVQLESFLDAAVSTPVVGGTVNDVSVTLVRATAPAGGVLATRSGLSPVLDAARQQLSFEVELVVVGRDSQPVPNLGAAAFALLACSPDAGVDGDECLRSTAGDLPYAPRAANPSRVEVIPGGVERPYAAALATDQSGSIAVSDPTGARLFAAKALLGSLGADDRVLLAAFAAAPGALIPTAPLTVYPPFRGPADAGGYFTDLDALRPLVGGNTPLYLAIDSLVAQLVTDPILPAGLAKATVVFTDGEDNLCVDLTACRAARGQTIDNAIANRVRLFTIGLSDQIDVESLGELAQGTGGAMLFAETAGQLLPLYGTVGRLISLSLPTYRVTWTVTTGAAGGFPPRSLIKGRVRVEADGSTFNVPFVVGIP